MVVRRYIDFLILLISCICSFLPTFCSFLKIFFVLYIYIYIYREDFAQQYGKCELAQARPNYLLISLLLYTCIIQCNLCWNEVL